MNGQSTFRLLLIEDSPAERRLVAELLRDATGGDVSVEAAATLAEGLEVVERAVPDAILLDLSLPDASGLEGLRRLRQATPETPIVVVTGLEDESLAWQAAREGAQDYLVKGSFGGGGLLRAVRYAIERSRQERRLRDQEALFRTVAESLGSALLVTDLEGRATYVNPRVEQLTGYSAEELEGRNALEFLVTGADRAYAAARLAARRDGDAEPTVSEMDVRRKDDGTFRARVLASAHRDGTGRTVGVVVVFDDVTEARAMESSLRERERHLGLIMEQVPAVVWTTDRELRFTSVAGTGLAGIGADAGERLGQRLADVFGEEAGVILAEHRKALGGASTSYEVDRRGRRFVTSLEALRAPGGRIDGVVGIALDITEARAAERELAHLQERLRDILRHSPVVMYTCGTSPPWDPTWVSDNVGRVLGYTFEQLTSREAFWLDLVHPADVDLFPAAVERLLLGEPGATASAEYRLRRADGSFQWVRDEMTLVRGRTGAPYEIVGALVDVTQRKLLEEQLRQSQKMEAVGRLAGGVAHDFNNILTAIGGYAELLGMEVESEAARNDLDEIRRATHRAATLTRQLLAFSRRQMLQAQPLDLNAVVREMEKMLRRVIGEDVVLETRLAGSLAAVRADPGQMEQVILNLAINARDAMPRGGRLLLSTAETTLDPESGAGVVEVRPGRYVELRVEDTGHGMDRETREHLFEPFFTTKTGGTGLGLATVYGIVKQSDGYVFVDSAPGEGARFRIYLPVIDGPAAAGEQAAPEPVVLEGREAILVVEDDASVRRLVVHALRSRGYAVTEAATGEDGLVAGREAGRRFDLLVSDVILPHMSGPELREQLEPDLKVLFISGYTALVGSEDLGPGVHFLQKPFTPLVLLERVRQILDNGRPSGERRALPDPDAS